MVNVNVGGALNNILRENMSTKWYTDAEAYKKSILLHTDKQLYLSYEGEVMENTVLTKELF